MALSNQPGDNGSTWVLQGGATYQSQVNREQVGDGVVLLSNIMPIIISIMLNSSEEDWGDIAYPVI